MKWRIEPAPHYYVIRLYEEAECKKIFESEERLVQLAPSSTNALPQLCGEVVTSWVGDNEPRYSERESVMLIPDPIKLYEIVDDPDEGKFLMCHEDQIIGTLWSSFLKARLEESDGKE